MFNVDVKLPDYKKIVSQIKKRKVVLAEEEIERLRQEKERLEKERLREEILEKIAKNSQIQLPQKLVEDEAKRMLENLKRQISFSLQISFEDYLKKIAKTEREILDSLFSDSQKSVRNSLILKKIEQEENITSSDEEVKLEMGKILSRFSDAGSLDREQLKEYTKEVIKQEKTFQLLENLTQEQ